MELLGSAFALFVLFGILAFIGIFVTVWLLVIRGIWQTVAQNRWNARQPIASVPARMVTKRSVVSGGGENYSASTRYFATFETPDGARRELPVSGIEYGQLAEGDTGVLSSQGTAYRGFERQRVTPRA